MSKKSYTLTLEDLASTATISVEQAANLIGISRQSAYEAVNRGELPVIRMGRRVRVLAQPLYAQLVGEFPGSNDQ
jgi:excisionase family DNA binding protein